MPPSQMVDRARSGVVLSPSGLICETFLPADVRRPRRVAALIAARAGGGSCVPESSGSRSPTRLHRESWDLVKANTTTASPTASQPTTSPT
jgi:hypothetical protein